MFIIYSRMQTNISHGYFVRVCVVVSNKYRIWCLNVGFSHIFLYHTHAQTFERTGWATALVKPSRNGAKRCVCTTCFILYLHTFHYSRGFVCLPTKTWNKGLLNYSRVRFKGTTPPPRWSQDVYWFTVLDTWLHHILWPRILFIKKGWPKIF